jgi:hypothetical protein
MVDALAAAKRKVPAYLARAAVESNEDDLERATFAMHCFWQGEAALGALDGVVATRPAFLDGLEVVEVTFNQRVLGYRELVRKSSSLDCAVRVYARSNEQLTLARELVGERAVRSDTGSRQAPASDCLRSLARSHLRYVPLTPMQATHVNAALAANADALEWLSPRQRVLARQIEQELRDQPAALEGLSRPDTIGELAAYDDALRSHLGAR